MKLTQFQKISLVFLACTLVPAYLVANWRYEANDAVISSRLEREEELLQSSQKLLANCEQNESKSDNPYDANHQVCATGEQAHERARSNIKALHEEKDSLHASWWQNFFITILSLSLLALIAYKGRQLLLNEKAD